MGSDTGFVPYRDSGGSQPGFHGETDEIGSGFQPQPLHQDGTMHLDSFFSEFELTGDLLV